MGARFGRRDGEGNAGNQGMHLDCDSRDDNRRAGNAAAGHHFPAIPPAADVSESGFIARSRGYAMKRFAVTGEALTLHPISKIKQSSAGGTVESAISPLTVRIFHSNTQMRYA
jgi:hypothetical protein